MQKQLSERWVHNFIGLAFHIADWSKDPSTRVGCVLVNNIESKRVVSLGYNGFPAGVPDTERNLADRPYKLAATVHAEMNAILNAAKAGAKLENALAFCTHCPCGPCAVHMAQAGITRLYYPGGNKEFEDRWADEQAYQIAAAAGLEIIMTEDILRSLLEDMK